MKIHVEDSVCVTAIFHYLVISMPRMVEMFKVVIIDDDDEWPVWWYETWYRNKGESFLEEELRYYQNRLVAKVMSLRQYEWWCDELDRAPARCEYLQQYFRTWKSHLDAEMFRLNIIRARKLQWKPLLMQAMLQKKKPGSGNYRTTALDKVVQCDDLNMYLREF